MWLGVGASEAEWHAGLRFYCRADFFECHPDRFDSVFGQQREIEVFGEAVFADVAPAERGTPFEGQLFIEGMLCKLGQEPAERVIKFNGLVRDAAPTSLPE